MKAEETVKPTVQSPHPAPAASAKADVGAKTAPPPRGNTSPLRPAGAPPHKPALNIPPILLEGDEPRSPLPVAGPGQKYALGPTPPDRLLAPEEGELPAAYGTGKLRLAARDPHWLYACWDFTGEQQQRFNGLSAHHHLIVRVGLHAHRGSSPIEAHVHPESRHWFIFVENAGTKYVAELGYYAANRQWVTIATSNPAATPADAPAQDETARFVTIPPEIPLPGLAELKRKTALKETQAPAAPPPTAAPEERTEAGEPEHRGAPLVAGPLQPEKKFPLPTAPEWTPAREYALTEFAGPEETRQAFISSIPITQPLRRQIEAGLSAMATAQFGLSSPAELNQPSLAPGEVVNASSPSGGEQAIPKDFWFNINAELVIYGATEPDALVTIGGRPIQLRPDGSFSYRFALPDGNYELPITAVSAQGQTRQAKLEFYRGTRCEGEVGAHPQDPRLKPPAPENVS